MTSNFRPPLPGPPPKGEGVGPIVIKIGGTTLEDPKTSPLLWDAIAALAQSRREGVIVVHGGGKAVDRLLERLGMSVERKHGLRVTPPEQMELIAGVLAGSLNKSIVASLLTRGVQAVGLCLGDGGAVPCIRKQLPDADLGLVGEVSASQRASGEASLLGVLISQGFVPVMSSIGIADSGSLLNVNADDGAAGVALHTGASTLVLMTDVPGVLDENKRVIPEAHAAAIEELISRGVISGGMIPKARAAAAASAMIGAPVIILSGNDPASLADWSRGQPVGTKVLGK
jgi:acetylglutamate kinase